MRGYFFRQAWQNLKENLWLNAITTGTITLSLLILGFFLVVFFNAKGLAEEWGSQIRITAYLTSAVNRQEIEFLLKKIRSWNAVQEVHYRSPEEALRILEEKLHEQKGLLKGLPRNPLPASLEIRLKPAYQNSLAVQGLADQLREEPEIEELQYGAEWVERFSAFMVVLKVVALGLGGMLLVTTIFVVANTIRLNIFARREEIEIMRWVGATGSFIRAPYYIEGLLQGSSGACLALGILFLLYRLFLRVIYEPVQSLLGNFPIQFLTLEQTAAMILGGVVLGLLGSQVSVGRYLRV
jgi:cell division transport system permease protein